MYDVQEIELARKNWCLQQVINYWSESTHKPQHTDKLLNIFAVVLSRCVTKIDKIFSYPPKTEMEINVDMQWN
jgi:hypothetical protein